MADTGKEYRQNESSQDLVPVSRRPSGKLAKPAAPAELMLTESEWLLRAELKKQLKNLNLSDWQISEIDKMDNKQLLVKIFNARTKIPEKILNLIPQETLKTQFSKTKEAMSTGDLIACNIGISSVSLMMTGILSISMSSSIPLILGIIGASVGCTALTKDEKNIKKKNHETGQETVKLLEEGPKRRLLRSSNDPY